MGLFVLSKGASTGPTFTLDGAAIITQAAAIFNSFSDALVVAIGISLGAGLLMVAKRMFSRR